MKRKDPYRRPHNTPEQWALAVYLINWAISGKDEDDWKTKAAEFLRSIK